MSVPTDQAILDAARTALYNLVVGGAQSFTVGGKVYTSVDIEKLQTIISTYQVLVDEAANPNGGRVLTNFGNAN